MDKQQAEITEQALKQLRNPVFKESKAAQGIEKMLVRSQESGKLASDDLRRGAVGLVEEFDIPKYFTQGGTDQDTTNSGLAILFLLIFLSILAALAADSDTGALIQELIQAILDALKGGS